MVRLSMFVPSRALWAPLRFAPVNLENSPLIPEINKPK